MGIFDVFTGDPAKKAAEENTARLNQLKTEGTAALKEGQTGALGALDQAGGYYAPLSAKYGAATTLGLDALGVNGPQGNTRAVDAFHAGPGYRYAVDQSLEGINRGAAARGGSFGGNTLAALGDRAGNMANQEYDNWVKNLNGYVSPELSAVGGQASAAAGKAPVYMQTANGIVGLDSNVANGINSQNTQAANAEMAGSGNLWGLGLNLAKLGVGAATGGTSLLGGAGNAIGGAIAPSGGYTGWTSRPNG